jgi:multiple sugar transport system ATP-binding protein
MNVRRNIGFPLSCQGMPRAEARTRVEEVARLLRIDHLLDRSVSGLSSGDRQRVALGRAIVRRPKAFMMDEPLGALDAEFRALMCDELRRLHERLHATTIYVTHDQLEAMSLADTIAVMNHGIVEQIASPQEIYDRPASLFVADFIGSPPMNFLTFHAGLAAGDTMIRLNGAEVPIPSPATAVAPAELVLGVRPEDIRIDDRSDLRGEILAVEYLGTTQLVTLETAHGRIRARLASSASARVGETVGLAFRTPRLSLFEGASGRAIATRKVAETVYG